MLELVLAVRYFQHSSRPLLHRAGISAMIASDILCTFAICAKIYLVVSLYPSGPPHGFPEFTLQTTAVIISSTFTTASFAKLFLCALYWVYTTFVTSSLRLKLGKIFGKVLSVQNFWGKFFTSGSNDSCGNHSTNHLSFLPLPFDPPIASVRLRREYRPLALRTAVVESEKPRWQRKGTVGIAVKDTEKHGDELGRGSRQKPRFQVRWSVVSGHSTYRPRCFKRPDEVTNVARTPLYFNLTKRRVRDAFCWNSGSCRAHDLARIFVCIGGFDPCTGVAIRLGHAHIQSPPATDYSVFFVWRHRRFDSTLLSVFLQLSGRSAYLLFFYSQGRVYALTISGNFAVGVPAQHTPTTTPKLNTITGAVFPVKHTSADDQAVMICDQSAECTDNHQTNSDCSAIQHNKFAVHLTLAARPVV
ncbi:hypothetical protein DFH08DRAFT_810377 [Mycena albidolilacea]|uniref:Uncharacterized protein n=1 Tax=Mycena albidolilacea TaxID=1033008 RepID=A0AAD6ZYZ8_9AGAR|nr:hypothetical protein DFH08DRAFT_810377 [Mycena albidolilacea]